MPVYQYEGKHYDLPEGLSNEQAIAKIENFLGKTGTPAKEEKPSPEAPITSGFLMGLKDPISGGAQLLPKGLEAVTSLGGLAPNPVSKFFGSEAERVNKMVQEEEAGYQASRKAQGEAGFDVARLAGNVINPANLAAVTRGPALVRAASTGAIAGAMQPVYEKNDEFWSSKALQAGLGATLGPLTELGVNAVGKLAGAVKSLSPTGREQAMKKYVESLAGEDKQAVIKALQDAKELVTGSRPTVAEALSNIPSAAELVAAQSKLASKTGLVGKFETRAVEQQAARVRALQGIAGTEAEKAALATERGAVTGAMRESALDMNEVATTALGNIDKQVNQQTGRLIQQLKDTLSPLQQTSPAFKLSTEDLVTSSKEAAMSLKKAQLDSLEQNGVFPLLSADITKQIDKALKGTQSDTSKAVLQAVKDKILSKTDENGIIGSRDLYENVRKMSNQDIAQLLNLGEKYASGGIPEQAAKTLGNVKKYIDASLDKSSDGLWSKYLNSYADYSSKLNRMEIGDYLVQKLQTPLDKESAGRFATAVENAAGTIKKSTGIPRYDKLEQVLTPKEVGTVNSVLADLSRKTKADSLASKVGQLDQGLPDVAGNIPGLLSKTVTITREALNYLQKGNQRKFNEKMAELMLDPSAMASLMSNGVSKGRISELTSAMFKYMDEPTKAAFIQAFTVPAVAQEAGK